MPHAFIPSIKALLLGGAAGAALVLSGGCASLSHAKDPVVADTQWAVTELDGETIPSSVTPTLAVAQDGSVSGSDGCNRFVGGLVLKVDGAAAASPSTGISTRMACPGTRNEVSRRYNALRSGTVSWRIEGDKLLLFTVEGRIIGLRRTD